MSSDTTATTGGSGGGNTVQVSNTEPEKKEKEGCC